MMYKPHFALKHYPFDTTLQPDELFESDSTRQAAHRIKHLLELRGIGLLCGEAGSGKTTLCRQVVSGLHSNLYRVCYVTLSTGSVMDSYNIIAGAFGLGRFVNRSAAYQAIRKTVSHLVTESRQHPVLIFDEAHYLHNEILKELRLLTNYKMDSQNRLCLLLVGHTELRRRIMISAQASLAQRIVLHCMLNGLERDEVGGYIEHRLRLAGSDVRIFEEQAVEMVAMASKGLPRRIDRIAHYALHAAASEQSRTVSINHVEKATLELVA